MKASQNCRECLWVDGTNKVMPIHRNLRRDPSGVHMRVSAPLSRPLMCEIRSVAAGFN